MLISSGRSTFLQAPSVGPCSPILGSLRIMVEDAWRRLDALGPVCRPRRSVSMIEDQPDDQEDQLLLAFLQAQREAVLAIVAGLDEEAWQRSVVPSGWTPAGLLEHLGGAEWHWFQGVVAGTSPQQPEDEDPQPYDPEAAFVSDSPSEEIIAFY